MGEKRRTVSSIAEVGEATLFSKYGLHLSLSINLLNYSTSGVYRRYKTEQDCSPY